MPTLRKEYLDPNAPPLGTEHHVFSRLETALKTHPASEATEIAQRLISAADAYVKSEIPFMGVAPFMKDEGITSRYNKTSPYYDRWKGTGFPFVDPDNGSLPEGEQRNEAGTRRATLTGVEYGTNENGLPKNPYLETSGINGRFGAQFGNNTTIDIMPVRIDIDDTGLEVLKMLEIINKHDEPAAIGGFVETKAGPDGKHIRDAEVIFHTKLKELFEEAVSGSIPLLPEFEAKLDHYAGPPAERPAMAKWDQVMKYDPTFLDRLEAMVRAEQITFEGPILLSPGTTDNSWGESSVSWFTITPEKWEAVVGESPKYPYAFTAGDDAKDVNFIEVTADSVAATHTPHRAFKAYVLADYILHRQAEGNEFSQSRILDQANDLITYFDEQRAINESKPIPEIL